MRLEMYEDSKSSIIRKLLQAGLQDIFLFPCSEVLDWLLLLFVYFLIVIPRFNKQTFSSMGNKKEAKILKRKRKSLHGELHTWQNSSNFGCFPIEAFTFLSPISFYPVAAWKIVISNNFTEYKHKILKRYVQKYITWSNVKKIIFLPLLTFSSQLFYTFLTTIIEIHNFRGQGQCWGKRNRRPHIWPRWTGVTQ